MYRGILLRSTRTYADRSQKPGKNARLYADRTRTVRGPFAAYADGGGPYADGADAEHVLANKWLRQLERAQRRGDHQATDRWASQAPRRLRNARRKATIHSCRSACRPRTKPLRRLGVDCIHASMTNFCDDGRWRSSTYSGRAICPVCCLHCTAFDCNVLQCHELFERASPENMCSNPTPKIVGSRIHVANSGAAGHRPVLKSLPSAPCSWLLPVPCFLIPALLGSCSSIPASRFVRLVPRSLLPGSCFQCPLGSWLHSWAP